VFDISVRINTALDIVRARGGYQDRTDADRSCAAVQLVQENYREPQREGVPSANTYFTTLKQTVLDLQRAAQSNTRGSRSHRDSENNAHVYVEKLQRLCIAEFLQQEIAISGVSDSALSSSIARELAEACEQFGFLERDPYLAEILAERSVSSMLARVQEYSQQIAQELSALVEEMGIRTTLR